MGAGPKSPKGPGICDLVLEWLAVAVACRGLIRALVFCGRSQPGRGPNNCTGLVLSSCAPRKFELPLPGTALAIRQGNFVSCRRAKIVAGLGWAGLGWERTFV